MSDEVKHEDQQRQAEEAHKQAVTQHNSSTAQSPTTSRTRGGFMGGGAFTTGLFLVAYFLVSYSLGYTTSQYNKLATGVIPNAVANQGQTGTQQVAGQQAQATGLQDGATVTEKLIAEDARTKGDKNAKVTIYEYSDFECPYCGSFFNGAYKQIEEKYVKTGKVKIVFKDFPLSFHPNAQKSAEAARCAQEQGRFWDMHDKMFANQKSLTVENYKKWAAELAINTTQFNQCLDSNKYADAVKKDLDEGIKIGVQGTPSFVINGQALVGAYPFEEFEKVIEQKLK